MRQVIVYWKTLKTGILTESDEGYSFAYEKDYLILPYTSKEVQSLADEIVRSQTIVTGV